MTAVPMKRLTAALARLPGIGRRTAERIAVKLGRDQTGLVPELIKALDEVQETVCACSKCGNLTLKTSNPCEYCTDPKRDSHVLCVVENASDIISIEESGSFRGRYHTLQGKLSPMSGEGVRDVAAQWLIQRIKEEGVEEVLLALNSDTESDATAAYLQHMIEPTGIKVTRLALGMPAGSAIAYSDPVTLSRAIQGRVAV